MIDEEIEASKFLMKVLQLSLRKRPAQAAGSPDLVYIVVPQWVECIPDCRSI